MAASIPTIFSHLIVHNFPIFQPILVKLVSKFMACKVGYVEALFKLGYQNALNILLKSLGKLLRQSIGIHVERNVKHVFLRNDALNGCITHQCFLVNFNSLCDSLKMVALL